MMGVVRHVDPREAWPTPVERRNELVNLAAVIAQGIAAMRSREGWSGGDSDENAKVAQDAFEIAANIVMCAERKYPRP